MDVIIGMLLGSGLVLVWLWIADPRAPRGIGASRRRALLDRAEYYQTPTWALTLACAGLALVAGLVVFTVTVTPALAIVAAIAAAAGPVWFLRVRAERMAKARAREWPGVIDDMLSGVRAGLSLGDVLGGLADHGPQSLRPHMAQFRADLRAGGTMTQALDGLKARLADPVADRVIEALRCAHEVGGPDLGVTLSQLAQMLRADQRTRGELQARQSWTVNGARLAAAAPWIVLVLLCVQPEAASAYRTSQGIGVLAFGAVVTIVSYRLMVVLGRLPDLARTFAPAPRRED